MAGVVVYLHSFLTSVLKTVVSGQLQRPTHLLQGKAPPVPTEYEVGWASELVWRLKTNICCPCPKSNSGRGKKTFSPKVLAGEISLFIHFLA